MNQAEDLRQKLLEHTERWCDLANEATAAGLIVQTSAFIAPDGKFHAIGPIIAKRIDPATAPQDKE